MAAAVVANLGAVLLMVGLAALRDRVTYRVAGVVLGILLIVLDMPALNALTGEGTAKAMAVVIGALFVVVPWFLPRARKSNETDAP
jgi:hypothetical protein